MEVNTPQALWFPDLYESEIEEQFPIQPLFTDGVPIPGPGFLAEALCHGDPPLKVKAPKRKKGEPLLPPAPPPSRPWLETMVRAALYRNDFCLNVKTDAGDEYVPFVPGHRWDTAGSGPVPCKAMLVGQCPGQEELRTLSNFSGKTSNELFRALDELKVEQTEFSEWYVTNLVKFPNPNPVAGSKISGSWVKDCLPLLYQEIRIVRPSYVLLLGGEATKALLGKGSKIKELSGQVKELSVPITGPNGEEQHTFKVMSCLHPAAIYREPADYSQFLASIRMFVNMTRGINIGDVETGLERHYIRDSASLTSLVTKVIEETPDGSIIAVDCEWEGSYPWEPGAYLRTVQLSHRPKFGAAIVVRLQGGSTNPDLPVECIRSELLRLLKSRPGRRVRIAGHNFKSDLPWLLSIGVDVTPEFDAPDDDPDPDGVTRLFAWQKTKDYGGFDTICAAHAYDETGPLKLEVLGSTLLGTPRYDDAIRAFNERYCKDNGIKSDDLPGFGNVPDNIILDYGAYDVDLDRRLVDLYNGLPGHQGLLDADRFGNSSREWFCHCQGEAPVLSEMEMSGILLNKPRAENLMNVYRSARTRLLAEFRIKYRWPEFNPNSVYQRREWLFGELLNGKYDKETGHSVRVRPEDAVSLYLQPLASSKKSGSKPWRPEWSRIRRPGEPDPTTDKTTTGILALINKVAAIGDLRDLLLIGQVLKFLKPPEPKKVNKPKGKKAVDPIPLEVTVSETVEEEEYEKGLLSFIGGDGRVRTHFLYAETGRLRSARPNLQNLTSEDKEEKYAKVLDALYTYSIRSLFVAKPGYVIVDADYAGAELALAAWMADDPNLIEHYNRSLLKKTDPQFYEIHCQNAVKTFKLNCSATKEGLKSIGRAGLRTGAKKKIFGSFYGQGSQAAAMQANEEGAGISIEEMDALQDFLNSQYSKLYGQFFPDCRYRVTKPGWLRNCYGCVSRFPQVNDNERKSALEREASNRPIQGGVAGAMKVAERNFWKYRRDNLGKPGTGFTFIAQVHDSLMFEVPVSEVNTFVEDVVPLCMRWGVPIIPTNLDGIPTGKGPYYLGVKSEVFLRWGEPITAAEAECHNIPSQFIAKK